ncbi:MAG TPA: endolytic transglycosylase MltG [Candidatus Nanoarchaeia archaeon]|nr:endolytic transglycosylase MltG [Candidatus Nanoarchaeia archaeon]
MKRIIIFLFIITVLGSVIYMYIQAGTFPVDKNDKSSKIFVIGKGESLTSIINTLQEQGLIRNKVVFFLIVKQLGIERKIQAGDFRLSSSMNAYQLAENLTHGTLDVWVTVIEGTRKEEIAEVISENLRIPQIEFLKYAKEGYLFPDSYLVPKDATAVAVINIFEVNLQRKFTNELRTRANRNGLTQDQVLVLASLVEREAKFDDDRQEVANILLKRIRNDWPLQVDATIQYALGYQPGTRSWWKHELSLDDLKIESPYNSYTNKGLPPTPIGNPGLATIQAVVSADPATENWFYVSDKQGKLHFAQTQAEHEENIRKYLK